MSKVIQQAVISDGSTVIQSAGDSVQFDARDADERLRKAHECYAQQRWDNALHFARLAAHAYIHLESWSKAAEAFTLCADVARELDRS